MEDIAKGVKNFSAALDGLEINHAKPDAELYHCPLCRDTGWILEEEVARPCVCKKRLEQSLRQERSGIPLKLRHYSFQNFRLAYYSRDLVPDSSISYYELAKRALDTCVSFSTKFLKNPALPGLLISGQAGSGKTHLAAATANRLVSQGKEVLFLVVPEFLDQLRGSYRQENEGLDELELVKRAYDAPVLIMDDLGAHNFTPWVQGKLFTIFNYRINRDLPCIVTTNLSSAELKAQIGERIFSRLLEGCQFLQLSIQKDIRFALRPKDMRE